MKGATKRKKFTEQDWLVLGLKMLGKFGPDGLTIERLCTSAKRTKGSFYHHFKDHDAFLSALMLHWRAAHTDELINATSGKKTAAAEQLIVLNDLAAALDPAVEIGVRRLAATSSTAAKIVAAADQARVAHLAKLHAVRTGMSRAEARQIGEIEYACFIGAMLVWPRRSRQDFARFGRKLASLIG